MLQASTTRLEYAVLRTGRAVSSSLVRSVRKMPGCGVSQAANRLQSGRENPVLPAVGDGAAHDSLGIAA